MLLRPNLIVINISVCNITGHILGLGNNFFVLQVYEKNVSVTYLTLTVLTLTTSY